MSLFNKIFKKEQKTTNLAGGEAYVQTPALELVSVLLTSFAQDQFYRKATDTNARLIELLAKNDAEFAAKAAIYARTKFGMRSITHLLAGELAKYATGKEWAKSFYEQIVYRPDDMTEIMAYYFNTQKLKLPNAMKKGFAAAFDKFDGYQLAKYRNANKDLKLVDVVNLIHPKPTDRNREALTLLVKNELRSVDTWESKLTKAGQNAENELEKETLKADAWTELIETRKIGYFALLRNLRNIMELVSDVVLDKALELLMTEKLIRNSLVLPFRFTTAYTEIKQINGKAARKVMAALDQAVDISLKNVPRFEGDTLVVLDVSGSMTGRPAEIGSLFAAILAKSNNADFMTFSDNAQYRQLNIRNSTLSIANDLNFAAGGTNFHAIFQTINQRYDRIIILSDMQGWIGGYSPKASFDAYKAKYKANPFIYSFDLQGYGSLQFPENKIFALAGFSDKIFDLMALLETDPKAIVNEINKVTFKV
jgi:hypothetical protein